MNPFRVPHLIILFLASLLTTCWLGMMLIHESGHMLAALVTGGNIQHLVFLPLAFSRTDISPNPHPLIVAWAGPIFGALFPLCAKAILDILRRPSYTLDCVAGFCLLANGAYIAFGSLANIGDTADLLRYGAPLWTLWLFGLPTFAAGLFLFHRLGPRMGLQTRAKPADLSVALVAAFVLLLTTLLIDAIQRPGKSPESTAIPAPRTQSAVRL